MSFFFEVYNGKKERKDEKGFLSSFLLPYHMLMYVSMLLPLWFCCVNFQKMKHIFFPCNDSFLCL